MTGARRHRHDKRRPGGMPRWQARLAYASLALLLGSGALWLAFHYGLRVQTEFGPQPHPLEYQWLRLHGAAAMLSLIAFGSLLPTHIATAWSARRNVRSGLCMVGACALLIATGYLLYYFADEGSRPWIGALHWGAGLAAPLLTAVHRRAGQTGRRQRHAHPAPPSAETAEAHTPQLSRT
ncbi:MAG: hypothetical protein HYV18_08900 [Gammaproteobacteria bacterium]|nr:hypothetical protein [Gammaproteobacteria bacterium]